MMGPLWVTFLLLATQVTFSLVDAESQVSCDLTPPLNSTKVSQLLRRYTEHVTNSSGDRNKTRSSPTTVLHLVEFELNTTGNASLTKSKLGWQDSCFDRIKFTLRQVALMNDKDPDQDQFPGNATMQYILNLLNSDATKVVLRDVNTTLNILRERKVDTDKRLDFFIRDVGFIVNKVSLLSILSYSLNSTDYNTTAALLGYNQDLLNVTLVQFAEFLFLSPEEFRHLTLEYVVRYLRSDRTFITNLQEFSKRVTGDWAVEMVKNLVNGSKDVKILTKLKEIYRGFNLTFIQFFWERRVQLSLFDYTIAELAIITGRDSAVIKNFTITELFEFLFKNAELTRLYTKSVEASKRMREKIIGHYKITNISLFLDHSNLTAAMLEQLTDIKYENYAIRFYIHRYARIHLNTSFTELETLAKLNPSSLENATVDNFQDLMSRIGVAQAVKLINESKTLRYLLDDRSKLKEYLTKLKEQIVKERQPLTKNFHLLFHEFDVSYLIYVHYHFKPALVYDQSVFNFTAMIKLKWDIFVMQFNFVVGNAPKLKQLFSKYTFEDISKFFGIRKYAILGWSFPDIVNRIIYLDTNDIEECKSKRHHCAKGSQCVNRLGGFTCTCPARFNVDPDNYCKDVNECKQWKHKNAGCSDNEYCLNTYGSFECVMKECDEGYKRSGSSCEDIDECKSFFNKCFPNAICHNLEGSYECVCPQWTEFHPRLKYCRDINECVKERPCVNISDSYCANRRDGYDCRCDSGFDATYDAKRVLLNCTDIDECSQTNWNLCHSQATCHNTNGSYNCKCKEGYVGNGRSCKQNRLVIDPLFLRLISIRSTTRVNPFLGFYYGGKVHSKIYISTNGLISIGKRYRRSSPKSCNGLKKDILAPFWASATGGQVGYRQFVNEEEGDAPVLTRVNELVKKNTNLIGFEANWGLVVSWSGIMPMYCFWFFCWPYRDETNTFQAVLATNGSASVVLYLYEDGGMNWNRRLGRRALVGYATKSGECHQYKGSFTESIFNIDEQSFVDPAGKSLSGMIIKVFSKENEPETPEEKCLSWIRKQPTDDEWQEGLPSCPCTGRAARSALTFEWWTQDRDRTCYVYIREENTKTCCYFRRNFWTRGALITSTRQAGRTVRYSPKSKSALYRDYDEKPFQTCCVDSNKYCNDYSQYRPVEQNCLSQPPTVCFCRWIFGFRLRPRPRRPRPWWRRSRRRGWFFGDPHITTLDGFTYSFNGLGDYILLNTADRSHILHGRTFRPQHKNGGPSNATVFSGFAMRNSKNTTVQVLFSDSINGNLSITVDNSTNVCNSFDINDLQRAPGFILKKTNDTLIVLFDSGFSVEITPGIGLLQIAFGVPPDLADKNTTGLLGKLNGDQSDDLTYRNGTFLPINSKDTEVFAFGQTWKVPDGKGLFILQNCTKQPVYFDGSFRPMFLSDFNMSAINQTIRTNCKYNKQCILDVLLTGNEALGMATLVFEEAQAEKRAAMDNQPPDITITPELANVTVNQSTTIQVTVEDPNNDTYTLSNTTSLPDGAVFNNDTGVLTWTPITGQQDQDLKLEFAAVDSKGASQVRTVAVKFCDCQNTQECDFTNVLKSNPNNSFEVVGCNCSDRYSGDYCETENDPCIPDNPCYGNVSCTVKTPPAAFGYKCGECPDGLVGDGEDCNDFDECFNSTTNTCHVNQKCINTAGSFRCECKTGYKVQSEGANCTDVDECNAITGKNDCGSNTVCTNNPGNFSCTCKEGFEGNTKTGCTDIDECLQDGRCNHECKNAVGSFNCTCKTGYKLNETKPGYFHCVDIDECKYLINNDCEQICENIPKSYRCSCREGYKLDADNKTCSVNVSCSGNHGCAQECIVISGSNICRCRRGYTLAGDGKACEDINECFNDTDGCGHNCTNLPGNYNCTCLHGYGLADNKRDCNDDDECKTNNGGCDYKCKNTKGGRTCSCKRGFALQGDKEKCKDIDECKNRSSICPAEGQKCTNKKGGYKCRCPKRQFPDRKSKCKKSKRYRFKMRLHTYQTRILDWKSSFEDQYSTDYEFIVNFIIFNINEFFKSKSRYTTSFYGCTVTGLKPGSIVANVSLNYDVNSNVSIADLDNEVKGANGSIGDLGFDPVASGVSDVDECSDPEANDCDSHATCKNEPGSFSCSCNDGYKGDGVSCVEDKKKTDKTALIVGLCVGIGLLIIIIVVIIICCYKREKKGGLHVSDEQYNNGVRSVHMAPTKSGEIYYGSDNKGRRGSDESAEGNYDVATAYYDNPASLKKDVETPM